MRLVRPLATVALGCALALAGCSHAPKPVTKDPVPAPPRTATRAHRPAPKVTKPAPAPAVPEPNSGVVSGSSTSAPIDTLPRKAVVPQVSEEERKELEKTSREEIDAARARLASLDPSKLDPEKQRKLQIAQGFIADAIAARNQQDWMRASQLATKARVLADELGAR